MFVSVLLWSGIYSGSCTGTQVMNVSPRGLSLGGIPEGYSDCTPSGIRGKQGEELDVRDTIRSTPGASPSHLGGRTGRDECDAFVSKGQTKSNREGKAFGVKSVYTPI